MITMLQVGRYGRFANMLWQVAGIIGIARKSHQPFAFPRLVNHDHKERFGSSEDIDVWKYFENELPVVPSIPFEQRYIHWGYHDVYLPVGNWDLSGHFQSPKYFEHCKEEVKYYLTMKGEEPNKYVAIHWRAGDYQDGDNAYHPRMKIEYYRQAMKHFTGPFLVFSDDLDKAKEMFGSDVEYSEGNYIEDFRIMKGCQGFICANSSYSALAAVLSEKKSVFPSTWFGPVAGITGQDIYPNGAIII